jgi:hypothetical protein
MSAPVFNLVVREVEALVPFDRNARMHGEAQVAQLASSIKEFGFTNPVLIDEDNVIIAGEGRVLAAKKLMLAAVPCIVLAGLSQEQKAAYVIADNKLAMNSDWDLDKLRAEIMDLNDLGLDMSLTGFDSVEINGLFDDPNDDTGDVSVGTGEAEPGKEVDWSGMPDFHQPNDKPFRTLILHFNDQASVDEFAKLVGQRLTDKTKYMWYPRPPVKVAAEAVYE